MTKAESIAYLRKLKQRDDDIESALPPIKWDVEEVMQELESGLTKDKPKPIV